MALDDDIAILSQAPLFNLLERDALRLVAFASESRTYREGDVLFKRGDRSDGGYVVSRGTIALDAREDVLLDELCPHGSVAQHALGDGHSQPARHEHGRCGVAEVVAVPVFLVTVADLE